MNAPQQNIPRDPTLGPTAEGGAHVIVTIESIYNLLLEVRDTVRTSETEQKSLAAKDNDHEQRIRSLERKVWLAAGGAAALATGVQALLPPLTG